MIQPISFGERFKYWFDNVMARGAPAMMVLLGLASVLFIALIAAIVSIFSLFPPRDADAAAPTFWEVLWGNLMRTLDSGTMGGDEGWGFRIAMLVVTIGGVILVASLIGIISSAFDSKVDELRKGKSRVLETDHTLILGWNAQVFALISEICIANQSRMRPVIVVLSEHDKVEMEEQIRARVPSIGKTRIICRSGDPMDLTDLEISNPHTARSIVILAPQDSEDPDATVIKTALALTNNPRRKAGLYHIVAEIKEERNLEAARLVGRDEAHWVLAADLISRITVQTCRQSGLSVVYTELLDFDGDEIYFSPQPDLNGRSYFEAQLAFSECSVIGYSRGGTVHLNPSSDAKLEGNDELILIASDDSTILRSNLGAPDLSAISNTPPVPASAERILVLGCNAQLIVMLKELDQYVTSGSSLLVVANIEQHLFAHLALERLQITVQRGDPTSRAVLDALNVAQYHHIIVLANKESLAPQQADARTLVTLLHLRDIADRAGIDMNVVSEMIDSRNRELAEVTKADDFIVSDKLISLMLSQISENKQLASVFEQLFSSHGSEIYLRPAEWYVKPDVSVNFYTVLEAARQRGETAIGYRLNAHARDAKNAYGVRVNPNKLESQRFGAGDKIIVLAEN